jgi:co-chaperonin GroES (HSP10)
MYNFGIIYQTILNMLSYEIRQAPTNTVIVEVGAVLDDTVSFGSLTLFIDPHYKPTENARIYGRVVAIPKGTCADEYGSEIVPKVEVWDIIYFHYLTTSDETNCIYGNYFKVPYYWIFCSIRNGNILPVGSWTLLEQVIEEEDSFTEMEISSQKMQVKMSSSGLITSVQKKKSTNIGVVRHIAEPLKDQEELGIKIGDKVLLTKNCNFVNKIEGKEYFTVKQENIMCQSVQ